MTENGSPRVLYYGRRHWGRQDRLDVIWWGLVFVWGAVVLFANVSGLSEQWHWWKGWGVFFVGAGALALLGSLIRLLFPAYRAKWVGSLIFGTILFAIGLSAWEAAGWIWVIVLLWAGGVTLFSAFTRRS
jgi:hypothetical protein